jgi:glutamyl-tRNA synthetase
MSKEKFITRFAPSPTGYLHIGNIRAALVNWLMALKNQGIFILRIDDTDIERSKKEYEEAIKEDLKWLGITWDKSFNQLDRIEKYESIKKYLMEKGRLYPCFETKEELDMKRKMLLNRGLPPIYDRAALNLSKQEIDILVAQGKKPHYRFLLDNSAIEWDDIVRGKISFDARNISDPILIREDGSMTYMLCSAIDDIDYEITHVIRGEDHISNTAIGIQIHHALGAETPKFGHLSLLKSKEKISKRNDTEFSIRNLRKSGIDPMTILSMLACLGTSDSIKPYYTVQELVDNFSLTKFSKASANYDPTDVERLNHKYLSNLDFASASKSIKDLNIDIEEHFWTSIRGNLNRIADLKDWYDICKSVIKPVIEDKDKVFLQQTISFLPEGNWSNSTWHEWIESIKPITERKGKELYMPIRLALTGKMHGPELQHILPHIGKDKAVKRLSGIEA